MTQLRRTTPFALPVKILQFGQGNFMRGFFDWQVDLLNERTKVVSLTWVSNMLGTINPVAEIAERAHQVGALVVVDASQAALSVR